MKEPCATKSDVIAVRNDVAQTRNDVAQTRKDVAETRNDLAQTRTDLNSRIDGVDERLRWVGILLERLDSKVDAIIEGLSTKASRTELNAVDERLGARISIVEDVVRDLAGQIAKR